jgi:GNAT superfamily N-acetyltransferase
MMADHITVKQGDYSVSTDPAVFNIEVIHDFLSHSYWAENIPLETMKRAINNSLCFGLFHKQQQIGFARVITDYSTFGYLADVFIIESYRGKGLARFLIGTIMQHPDLKGFRKWLLATRDAHGLYGKFGFKPIEKPERLMEISRPGIYVTENK